MQARLFLPALLAAAALGRGLAAQGLYDESVLRTLELTFHQPNWWALLTQNYASKTYIKADLKAGSLTYKDVGVRFRGNSSYKAIGASQKKPFKISMDRFVPGQRLMGHRTLNLNNSFRDPTFTREIVSYWIFRGLMPASRANYVKLVINGQSWGPYINVEQINKDLLGEWFRDDGGNRYRGERQPFAPRDASALIWLGSDPNAYRRGYEVKNATPVNPWVDVRDLCQVLNTTRADKLPLELPKVLDVDESLRYSAGQVVVPALDSYIGNAAHNFYLYHDGYHGRFSVLPWDLNATFGGNGWLTVQQKIRLSPFFQATNVNRPMLRLVLAHPPWRQRFLAHIRTLLDTVYDWKILGPRIAALQKFIEPELRKDSKRLYSMQLFKDNVVRDIQILIGFRRQWIPGLEPFVKGRRSFLLADPDVGRKAPVLTGLARTPLRPTVRDVVRVRVKVVNPVAPGPVELYWRVRGPWATSPMFDDGQHGDGQARDGVYGGSIPAEPRGTRVDYYVGAASATSAGGARTFAPRAAGHAAESYRVEWPRKTSPIRINELLARNDTGITDGKGEREDWFELFNSGSTAVPVGGLWLTDDLGRPQQWRLPAGLTIQPGAALLVWADAEANEGPLHANFKLDAAGEELGLFDRDGITLLDAIAFGPQKSDVSLGRLRDGGLPWVSFPLRSTPKARNDPGPCGYRHYSALEPGAHTMALLGSGSPKIGGRGSWRFAGAPPNGFFFVFLAASPANIDLPFGIALLVGGPIFDVLALPADARGSAVLTFPIADDKGLVGARLYAFAVSIGAPGFLASNGLETRFCPK